MLVPEKLSGDVDVVNNFALVYDRTATALRDAATHLLELANNEVSISLAIDEVRNKARDAHSNTVKVANRYEGASSTYSAYGRGLRDAQQKAERARELIANEASANMYWHSRRVQLIDQAAFSPPNDQLVEDLKEANDKLRQFEADFEFAMRIYNEAVEDKRHAVVAAMSGLDEAADSAGLNDGFLDGIAGQAEQLYSLAQKYLAPLIKQLRGILEAIKGIVDILSLIVSILAIFLPFLAPLAAALILVSVALSAMIFLCSLALFALGKESMGKVLGDLMNVAIGVVTAKLGGLKLGSVSKIASNMKGIGSTITRLGWKEGVDQGKLIFEVFPFGTAIGSRMTAVGKDYAVGFVSSLVSGSVSSGVQSAVDAMPSPGGAPWAADAPVTESFVDRLGTTVLDSVSHGVTGGVQTFTDGVSDLSSGFTDSMTNGSDILAVTSR